MTIPLHLRFATIVTILAACEVVLIFLFITPSIQEIRALEGMVDARMRDLELRYQRGAHFSKLTATYEKYARTIDQWKKLFVEKGEVSVLEIITQLETLAGRAGVTKTIQLTPASSSLRPLEGARPQPLDLTVEGPFSNVLVYLRSIERLPMFYTIDQWSFVEQNPLTDPGSTATQKGNVLVHITGSLWQAP